MTAWWEKKACRDHLFDIERKILAPRNTGAVGRSDLVASGFIGLGSRLSSGPENGWWVIFRESEPDYAARPGLPGPRQKAEARRASSRAFNIGDLVSIPSLKVSREYALGLIRE